MNRFRPLLACLALAAGGLSAQEINVLTDLGTPFPAGCVSVALPEGPVDQENTLVDDFWAVPIVGNDNPSGEVRVTIWRVGCADEGYSVVMVRLENTSDDVNAEVLVPQIYAEAGDVAVPDHQAQLISRPAPGNVGASANTIPRDGMTYMLVVEPNPLSGDSFFSYPEYNDFFSLELYWGAYTGFDQFISLDIPEYFPPDDPPQSDPPILNGRYSGQYIVEGLPRQGLVLQVAETEDGENYYFAIFFTYINGDPHWVGGNTLADTPGQNSVTIDMYDLEGGQFVTAIPGSYGPGDVTQSLVGSITLEAEDCNTLIGDYNFNPGGFGTGSITFERLIRIAGYDCNQWEYD